MNMQQFWALRIATAPAPAAAEYRLIPSVSHICYTAPTAALCHECLTDTVELTAYLYTLSLIKQ